MNFPALRVFFLFFSFFRRLLQSPIAYGFQISDVFFWVFLCIRCVRFCMHLSTSNTGIFFSRLSLATIVHNVIVFCSMRAWFVLILFLRWKGAQFKNHHYHHHRFGFECSFLIRLFLSILSCPKHKMGVELIDYTTK